MRGTHKGRLKKDRYVADILRLVDEGALRPGVVTLADVFHDGWCAFWQGGYCDCEPDIRLREWAEPQAQEANA